MKSPYYIFSSGRLQRHQDTLYLRRFEDPDELDTGPSLEDALFHGGCALEDHDDLQDEFVFDDGPYQPRPTVGKRPIPIHQIDSIFLFGECDMNAKFSNFLGRSRVPLHFFNYYGFYTGSYWPRQEVVSGFLTVNQVFLYADNAKRTDLARRLVDGATTNILKNLGYYNSASRGRDLSIYINDIQHLQAQIKGAMNVWTWSGSLH